MLDPQVAAKTLLKEGIALARAGNKAVARKQIRRAAMLDPTNETICLCQTVLAENAQEAYQALERAQVLNPVHPHLEKARAWISQTWPAPTKAPKEATFKKKSFPFIFRRAVSAASVSLVIIVGLFTVISNFSEARATSLLTSIVATPTQTSTQKLVELQQAANQASTADNRTAMIENLLKMRALAPTDEQIAGQLAQLYYEQGLAWRDANRLEPAQQSFEWALSVKPDFFAAKEEQQLAKLYLTGIEHYKKGEWPRAVTMFEQVYQQNPAYLYVDEILYSAYYNLGVVQEAAGELSSAIEVYRQATEILPNAPEANLKVKEVALKLKPSTPAPIPKPRVEKRILVDISEQRAYVYESGELIYEFIVSTGEPGRDTAPGEFEIQSKIPMAYASTWNLDMPYWLGIYWAGPLENGFHAVPTVRDTGQTMWDGYLGQRVSYGCIILSMEDAKTLYNWADMGTPVAIRQ